ncbi:hypothetical protein J7E57_10680 [Pedobacter sp. ISL-64]|nr:hypothetical protein [Pedobacter sp. ISL-64]
MNKDIFSLLIFLPQKQSNPIYTNLTMKVENKTLKTSDKTGNEARENVFPKRMILFILVLSAILMILVLFKD